LLVAIAQREGATESNEHQKTGNDSDGSSGRGRAFKIRNSGGETLCCWLSFGDWASNVEKRNFAKRSALEFILDALEEIKIFRIEFLDLSPSLLIIFGRSFDLSYKNFVVAVLPGRVRSFIG
jgi:hypothetical protein